ncbi:HET-domain-containing protein [Melanomma pulvis-pyrius CBS 109.77]|uniref:HET-domain-containing protein n=1 Tax=Melanomma pulvis-pyrius CBS 109.77 TaxID=1314802 RepID=A0A6A6WSW6_9PLEO|nr:HET-domain-containing protein [Melanomma pulvis-pyrius CBS 109.77]
MDSSVGKPLSFWQRESGLRVTFHGENVAVGGFDIEIFASEDCGGLIPKAGLVSISTESEAAFEQVATWFLSCLNTHRGFCSTMYTNRLLPYRILDLGSGGLTGKIMLRETQSQIGKYACLSHCWGGHQPLQTTIETLEQHKEEIGWDALPKTFQDAVTYTRRLTLQYLWIDSLCIIQDDIDDWNTQAAQMAEIYRNGIITLSAAASKGPDDGLFVMTRSKHIAVEVPLPSNATGGPKFFTRYPIPHSAGDHPLLTRGWVLQERLLSPRVLHFGAFEMIWECMQSYKCECGASKNTNSWLDWKTKFHPDMLADCPPKFAAESWHNLVKDFSGLNLSQMKDVLPAVSGAAKIIQQKLQSTGLKATYIAGMWYCWFIEDCLWNVSSPTGSRPEEWQGPTFSWASIACIKDISYAAHSIFELRFLPEGEFSVRNCPTLHASIKEHSCELKGADETGQVASASVLLSGPLMKATLDQDDLIIHGQVRYFNSQFWPDYDFSIPGDYQIENGSTLWCLKILSVKQPLKDPIVQDMWFLILRQVGVDGSGQRVFERVGLLKYRDGYDVKLPVREWFDPKHVEEDATVKII